MKKQLVFDYDYIRFAAASLCEDRVIDVTHNASGKVKRFKTRTEFYGHHSKKAGGWLAEANKDRRVPWLPSDFTITDVQVPKSIDTGYNVVDFMIKAVQKKLDIQSYKGYLGKGDSWRVEHSRIIEYKGNRKNSARPLFIEEITDYFLDKHPCEIITNLEVDDKVVMECTGNKLKVLVGVDKDYEGCQGINLYNPNSEDASFRYINGLGKLYLNEKGDVKGSGYIWLLHQIASGDSSDNYFANSATTTKWGEKGSYKRLVECTSIEAAKQATVEIYKHLYPTPFEWAGWRGDTLKLDWQAVLKENFTMARMLTNEFELVQLDDIFNEHFGEYL